MDDHSGFRAVTSERALAREAALCASAAGAIAAALAWIGPPGSDLAAHAYQRTLFLHEGFTLWNNLWYAGRYSFVTYSVLYYPLAALLGIRPLGVATIGLAALAFAVVVWREWGPTTRWSSRAFAVVWAGLVLSAAFPFALGMALALLAVWALQGDARGRFAGLAALTLAASPVAFLLLAVVVAGAGLARRASLRRNWLPLTALTLAGLIEVVLWRIFPSGGRYPFSLPEAAAGVLFCILGVACTWRIEAARVLRFVFAVYLGACISAYLVPSGIGENIVRLRFAAIPLAVLVFSLRRWRPLPVGIAVVALALSWNLTPLAASFVHGQADTSAKRSSWTAGIRFLRSHLQPAYRVEAVDTVGHWPAVYLADAGIPLARGWFRQDDFPQNQVLYSSFGPRAYLRWLRSLGVRYVVLTDSPPDYSARAEERLVRSERAGLVPVFRTPTLTIYAVPKPRPIIGGPRSPKLLSLDRAHVVVALHGGGSYRIAVRWNPYWHASRGCLRKGEDEMLRLRTRSGGIVEITFSVNAERALDELTGESPRCAPR